MMILVDVGGKASRFLFTCDKKITNNNGGQSMIALHR